MKGMPGTEHSSLRSSRLTRARASGAALYTLLPCPPRFALSSILASLTRGQGRGSRSGYKVLTAFSLAFLLLLVLPTQLFLQGRSQASSRAARRLLLTGTEPGEAQGSSLHPTREPPYPRITWQPRLAPATNSTGSTEFLTGPQRCRSPRANESIPHLQLVGSWDSTRPGSTQPITLVAAHGLERLEQLAHQCRSWPNALVTAIYLPLLNGTLFSVDSQGLNGTSLEEALATLNRFHARMASEGSCNLKMQLFKEDVDPYTAPLYPINAMRNRAMQMVETEALLSLDVDFIVSQQFAQELGSSNGWEALSRQLDITPVVLVPAFEPNATWLFQKGDRGYKGLDWGKEIALRSIEVGKQEMVEMWANYSMIQFHNYWADGHRCIQYEQWLGERDFYDIQYTHECEPDFIIRRSHMPWYDERFRGYGRNKMVVYRALMKGGATFSVHPWAYVVHVPHEISKGKATTMSSGQKERLKKWYFDSVDELELGTYYPVTDFTDRCSLRPASSAGRRA